MAIDPSLLEGFVSDHEVGTLGLSASFVLTFLLYVMDDFAIRSVKDHTRSCLKGGLGAPARLRPLPFESLIEQPRSGDGLCPFSEATVVSVVPVLVRRVLCASE